MPNTSLGRDDRSRPPFFLLSELQLINSLTFQGFMEHGHYLQGRFRGTRSTCFCCLPWLFSPFIFFKVRFLKRDLLGSIFVKSRKRVILVYSKFYRSLGFGMLSTNSNNKGNGCCTVAEVLEPRDYLAWYGIKSNSLLNKFGGCQ